MRIDSSLEVQMAGPIEVRIPGPEGMRVAVRNADGTFDSSFVEAPGSISLLPGRTYRLKLSDLPNLPGTELYPSLELKRVDPATAAVLLGNPIPLALSEEEVAQASEGTALLTKVLVLPDAQHKGKLKAATQDSPLGVLASTDYPELDVVEKAPEYGAVIAVLRIGNIDLELPASKALQDNGDTLQVRFAGPEGMTVQVATSDGKVIASDEAPCRFGLPQEITFQFTLRDIPARPKLALSGTLQVLKSEPRSQAFLRHACIPITLPQEYLHDLASANSITILIALPGPNDRKDMGRAALLKTPVIQSKLPPNVSVDGTVKEQSKDRAVLAVVTIGPK